ncbi:MAG: ABC transporter substrate-binding protein [Solirubrobacterales bacterium]|nr:MAG: ABC transporter substrate-binding protein [Solirubrobacterales bacterium]
MHARDSTHPLSGAGSLAIGCPLAGSLLATLALLLSGCGVGASPGPGGAVRVVAAENFWGSIASQLGGTRTSVQSIIVNPAQDPHAYEPTPADARTLALAQLTIVNGVGYDPWAPKLLAADSAARRVALDVGGLLALGQGKNSHRWYDPTDVELVASAITADLTKLDPKDERYFAQRHALFERLGLARYHALIARIKARYAGVPVGASESIFAPLAPALGLRLVTPPSFMNAISEGTEVTAQDAGTAQRQITGHEIKVWLYNTQNATPEVQRLNALARGARIPIATVTETLSPPTDSFEQWQVAQLRGLALALHEATGR